MNRMVLLLKCSVLLTLLFVTTQSNGQNCTTGGISLESQQDIDDFALNYPGCSVIDGSISINPANGQVINNLNGLSQITEIQGSLNINNEVSLIDFTGLDNLTRIGNGFQTFGGVVANTTLTSFTGLESLESVGGLIILQGIWENLTTLEGLDNLALAESSMIIYLSSLTTLTGLESLTQVDGNLTIGFVYDLENLNGLQNLDSVGGNFDLFVSYEMENLTGLDGLVSIGGYFRIRSMFALESLEGLNSLQSVGDYFKLTQLNSLTNFSELSGSFSIGTSIEVNSTAASNLDGLQSLTGFDEVIITNNANLSSCEIENFCDFLNVPTNIATINNNAVGCNSRAEVEAACLLALPVDLLRFEGKTEEESIALSWQTASETNNYGFHLQRSSDTRDWQTIYFQNGQGNADEISHYQFIDKTPHTETNYYRLVQEDFDGTENIYEVISFDFQDNSTIRIFPSIVQNTINIHGIDQGEAIIFNQLGQVVLQLVFDTNPIDLSELDDGVYFIQINSANKAETFHLLKI